MSDIEADISDAIFTKVEAVVAASSIPALPIMFPLRTFLIPNDNKYIEVIQIRNNNANEYWDIGKTYQGIVRLLLHWSNDNAGAIVPQRYLAEIALQLVKGSVLRAGAAVVVLYDNPDAGSFVINGQDCFFPLTLLYRDFYTA